MKRRPVWVARSQLTASQPDSCIQEARIMCSRAAPPSPAGRGAHGLDSGRLSRCVRHQGRAVPAEEGRSRWAAPAFEWRWPPAAAAPCLLWIRLRYTVPFRQSIQQRSPLLQSGACSVHHQLACLTNRGQVAANRWDPSKQSSCGEGATRAGNRWQRGQADNEGALVRQLTVGIPGSGHYRQQCVAI